MNSTVVNMKATRVAPLLPHPPLLDPNRNNIYPDKPLHLNQTNSMSQQQLTWEYPTTKFYWVATMTTYNTHKASQDRRSQLS